MWRATVGVLLWLTGQAHAGDITGVVYDRATGERVAGATVVASSPALSGTFAEITDDTGWYRIAGLPSGSYDLTVYYGESVVERHGVVVLADTLANQVFSIPPAEWGGCILYLPTCCSAPIIDQAVAVSRTTERDLLSHLPRPHWRYPLPADLRADGIPWPAGAPPPPDMFVDEINLHHAGLLSSRAAAGPAADIALRSGSNQHQLALATRRSPTASESAARIAGPLARDRAWYNLGVATGPSLAGLARLDYAHSADHQLSSFAYADRIPPPARSPLTPLPAAGTSQSPISQVALAAATWRSRFDDNKLDLSFAASASRITRGATVDDRTTAHARLVRRHRLLFGHHITTAGVERTDALAAWLEDSWQPRPDWTLEAGARFEQAAHRLVPRVGLVHDWTQEGRSRAFLSASTLELLAGAEYEVIEDLALVGSWRHAAADHGLITGARLRGSRRTVFAHYEIDRAKATGDLTHRVLAGATAELDLCFARAWFAGVHVIRAVRGLPPGSDSAGAQLGKRFSPSDDLDLSLAAELVTAAAGTTAWLSLRVDH